jgi:DNA-binding response OmpR family regulator
MSKQTTILYVDDEDTLRTLVRDQLQLEGFTVDTADDGDTALAMFPNKTYDVVLLDVRMPRMSGIDVLKHIKEKGIKSRVIMLTGVDDLGVAIEAVKNGANDYVTKPYDLTNLIRCIKRVVSK